ncbi:hypothetical protein BGZ94_002356 [Podila epigama]|nr:hypothetical protein BGZ94_002356 [Podila epigama]
MKFTTTLLAAAITMASYVNADMIQINNPTVGTIWTAGVSNFVGWSGNCNSMGPAAMNVTVILNTGPSEAVRYVATLGTLDCSGTSTRTDLTVPLSVPSGTYSIVVRTVPELSYTNMFKINNPSMPAPAGSDSSSSPPSTPPPASGDNSNVNVNANAGAGVSTPGPVTTTAGANSATRLGQTVAAAGLGAMVMASVQLFL